jgi:hypothetical protein
MEDKTVTSIILLSAFIRTFIDVSQYYQNCYNKKSYVFLILLIHALVASYMFLGWLYNDKTKLKFFLLFWVFVLLHWLTNNGQCFLTVWTNKVCGFPISMNYNPKNKLLTIVAIVGISVAIFKLKK